MKRVRLMYNFGCVPHSGRLPTSLRHNHLSRHASLRVSWSLFRRIALDTMTGTS
jgi:hypothetical protein